MKPISKTNDKATSVYGIIPDERRIINSLDSELHSISLSLNLSKILRPTNYTEELDRFVSAK